MSNKRGPGAPAGRRPELLICVAVVDGKIVWKKYLIKDKEPESDKGFFPIDEALAQFKDEYGVEPEAKFQHLYEKKSAKKSKAKKKTVSRDFEGMTLSTDDTKKAIYNGWKGIVFETLGSDKALFVFTEEVNPTSKKKNPPAAAQINKSELEFL